MRHRIIILTVVTPLIIGVIYAILDIPARMRFSVVDTELKNMQLKVMDPIGAITWSSYHNGDGFFDSFNCFPDQHCPRIAREWVVPVAQGKESDFATSILTQEGYTVGTNTCPFDSRESCAVDGTKNKLEMHIDIGAVNPAQKPTKDVSPQVWRHATITVDYYWDRRN